MPAASGYEIVVIGSDRTGILKPTNASSFGRATGSDFHKIAAARLKMAVVPPMPKPTHEIAIPAKIDLTVGVDSTAFTGQS